LISVAPSAVLTWASKASRASMVAASLRVPTYVVTV
jgi:hypothetical protein